MPKKTLRFAEKLSPGLLKIIRNVGWLSLEKVLAMLLNLSVGIYMMRYLGADDFGKLSFCLSLVGIIEAIAKLGLDAVVVRDLVKNEESTPEILGTALALKLLASLATLIIIAIVGIVMPQPDRIYWMTAIVACKLVFSSCEVIDFWFQSKVFSGAIVLVRSIKLVLSSIAKVLFIAWGWGLMAFVWLLLVEEIWRAVGTVWVYLRCSLPKQINSERHPAIWHWKFDSALAVTMFCDSWPLILSAVMITIYMKIDQVMLGNMVGTEAVGNYAAAIRFSEIWYFVPTAICASVFPSIVRARQQGKQVYYTKLQQLYDLMAWMSLSLAAIVTFISEPLTSTLLGAEYTEAGKILAWHIWAGPFVFLGVARSQWLMAENLTQLSFACTFLGTVINIALNFWLIPQSGGVGAAIATVISYAVSSYFTCIVYPRMFDTAWMLTKALFVPLRIRQNSIYLNYVKKIFS